jgi:hypothetical protein
MSDVKQVTEKEMIEWVDLACEDCPLSTGFDGCGSLSEDIGGVLILTTNRCRKIRRSIVGLIRRRKP